MRKLLKMTLSVAIFTLLFSNTYVVADDGEGHELHASDIQPWRAGTHIEVNSHVFEADFGDLGGGPFETDDPGIDVDIEKGSFTPGNWLRFQQVGTLHYWNGTQWSDVVPNAERIEVVDALNNSVAFNAGSENEVTGIMGEINGAGGLHGHLEFKILDASNTPNGSVGAYRIQFKLIETLPQDNTPVSSSESPVTIVFNRGLGEDPFEQAVSAVSNLDDSAVFVAETGVLTIQRVKALGTFYKVKMRSIGNNQFELIEAGEVHDDMH